MADTVKGVREKEREERKPVSKSAVFDTDITWNGKRKRERKKRYERETTLYVHVILTMSNAVFHTRYEKQKNSRNRAKTFFHNFVKFRKNSEKNK